MRVLFVANHGPHDNQDEDAVAHALDALGHEVVRVEERRKRRAGEDPTRVDADFCLIFKHPDVSEVAAVARNMPVVYWYFDMIRSVEDDPTLRDRSESRVRWCQSVLPHVLVGFHTDGDWVAADASGKLVHLTQGADERVTGPGVPAGPGPEILFTGMIHHGRRRAEHVAHLRRKWDDRFCVLGDGGARHRVHGRKLADFLCSAKVVVAPDGPTTHSYWSNRVYLTCGFGAFLVHPKCKKLTEQYPFEDLVTYESRAELDEIIDAFLRNPEYRTKMAERGYRRTVAANLYRHRVIDLLRVVKERL